MEYCNTRYDDVVHNLSGDRCFRCMRVEFSFAAGFSSFECSFVHSPSSGQRESHIREHETHVILSSTMCQLVGTNLLFETNFIMI